MISWCFILRLKWRSNVICINISIRIRLLLLLPSHHPFLIKVVLNHDDETGKEEEHEVSDEYEDQIESSKIPWWLIEMFISRVAGKIATKMCYEQSFTICKGKT